MAEKKRPTAFSKRSRKRITEQMQKGKPPVIVGGVFKIRKVKKKKKHGSKHRG